LTNKTNRNIFVFEINIINPVCRQAGIKLLIMKNLILSVAVILATGMTPALVYAADNDPGVEKVFAQQFAGAENVKWTKLSDGYQKATFTFNGVRVAF
jgi:hypothetical protein